MSDGPSKTKAIASLAKKQNDVTRQGTQKLKFTPTLPPRRKTTEVKAEPGPSQSLEGTPDRGRGRGQGRGGRGAGRGRGRGGPPAVEMTASGPFAMGPALAGNDSRRAAPRVNAPVVPSGDAANAHGASLTGTAAPAIKRQNDLKGKQAEVQRDDDEYSDPDEGVEIIDLQDVKGMDYMAPESLRPEFKRVKKEEAHDGEEIDHTNALHLSESEDEMELEDVIDDFSTENTEDPGLHQDKLYFFQFPSPFPKFVSSQSASTAASSTAKKVTFAADAKVDDATQADPPVEDLPVDGTIGELEVYRSGAVKLRLTNGVLLEVRGATQPSFLQYAVSVDAVDNEMTLLGEVNKRFVVYPDIDFLLESMVKADEKQEPLFPGADELIAMDTS